MVSNFFQSEPKTETNELQQFEINLLIGFYRELKAEFALNRWTDKEGFNYVLAAGLAALQNARQSRLLSQDESIIIDQLQSERIYIYGRYAAMKHLASELSNDVKCLEAQFNAVKAQLSALHQQNRRADE